MFNTNREGKSFDEATIQKVWEKGKTISGVDPAVFRMDRCETWMKRSEYGNKQSSFGWEIDHIVPKSRSGSDDLSNLQPLQWENNRHKGDHWPNWSCKVEAA